MLHGAGDTYYSSLPEENIYEAVELYLSQYRQDEIYSSVLLDSEEVVASAATTWYWCFGVGLHQLFNEAVFY